MGICECCDCLYTWDVACSLSISSLTLQKNVIMFFWPVERLQEVNPLKHREISGLKPQHFSDSFRLERECVYMHMKQYWEAALKRTKPQSSYPENTVSGITSYIHHRSKACTISSFKKKNYIICSIVNKYWLMWFESLLVFILFKFKKCYSKM